MDTNYVRDQVQTSKLYNDIQGMKRLRAKAGEYDPKAIHDVAQKFESLFLQMMLKSMRDAGHVLKSDMLSGSETEHYEEMYHQQLAVEMSKKGMGIADMLVKQLSKYTQNNSPSDHDQSEAMHAPIETAQKHRVSGSVFGQETEVKTSFKDAKDFVEKLLPYAEKAAAILGLDPKLLLAQAALETGWGQAIIGQGEGQNSYNLFGIKAHDWQGQTRTATTHEVKQGQSQLQVATFRSYDSYQHSFDDYQQFLQDNPRYSRALAVANDPEQFVHELQKAGYATDPSYAKKIMQLYQSSVLQSTEEKGA